MTPRTIDAMAWLLKQPDWAISCPPNSLCWLTVNGRSFSSISPEIAIEEAHEALYLDGARDAIRREEQ